MKLLFCVFAFLSYNAMAAEPQNFDILLTGKTAAGPHPNDDAATRKLVAKFVENLKVKTYSLQAKPTNGGYRVCIEPAGEDGYQFIVGELNTISVRGSIWEVNLVESCPEKSSEK